MGSKNQHKNINAGSVSIHTPSGSSASTSSKQVSKASKKAKVIDDDSDSEIFGDIGGRGSCEKRLGAEFFNTEKKVLVLFGEIYSDEEKNIEITWETEPILAAIVWSKSCNDKKQAGICVDDTGFAGWDIKHKVYLTYNSPITANEFCMKIVNLTPPEPVEPEPTSDFSSLMSEDDSADSKASKKLCSYSFTKGKNKGEVCGKSVNGESDYCKTHSKTGAKQKGIAPDIVTAITLALKEILSKDSTPLVALTEIIEKLESPEAQSLLSDILKTPSKQPKSSSQSDSESESKTEKKRKVKKEKDPDAPKRPLTPYILFCMEKRDTVKTDNPSMGGKEVTTELGRLWKELTDDEKDIYKKKYQEDKVRYASELSNYESPDESPTEKKTVKKSNKKTTGPKRGLSSYIFFCQENRAVVKADEPDFDAKEVTRELGRRWSALSDTDKEPFIKLAEADKVRYEKEKEQSDEDTEPEKIKPSPKKTTKSKPEPEQEPAPPKQKKADSQKKGTDGFTQFVLQNRESCLSSNPTLKPPAIMNKLQELWDDMDDEEKLNYNK